MRKSFLRKASIVLLSATMLIVAAIASQTGVIADVIGYSPRNAAAARHSYGIIYPTDFAAHIFYLILAVSCHYKHDRYHRRIYL